MKLLFLKLILILSTLTLYGQSKFVSVNVDVLGKKHPTVRYYHPINGTYAIQTKRIEIAKERKSLPGYHFIQPVDFLSDSISAVQANSLRYYVDPNELIYINWAMGVDSSNEVRVDSFKIESKEIRDSKYKPLIDAYLNPFFISKYEITNKEYREFVYWVVDSLFREAVFSSDSISNEEALMFLKIPKEIRKNGTYSEVKMGYTPLSEQSRFVLRELYPFDWNFDYRKEFADVIVIPIISKYYQRPNERFYKKRVIDKKHLNYRYYTVEDPARDISPISFLKNEDATGKKHRVIDHDLNTYPDTTCWEKIVKNPIINLYFWHPAYNNYPVVGISHEQANAFCHWKQMQLKKKYPEIATNFEYDLPRTYEYEWAITEHHPLNTQTIIQDNELLTNLLLGLKSEPEWKGYYAYLVGNQSYTQNVYAPVKQRHPDKKRRKKKSSFVYDINTLEAIENNQNRLPNGIRFLSNNISEWMDEVHSNQYQALLEAYINYNCLANPEYCENQRKIDQNFAQLNDHGGNLIMGANWYDERYGSYYGINTAGLYPKTFKKADKSFATVGFRCVLRYKGEH